MVYIHMLSTPQDPRSFMSSWWYPCISTKIICMLSSAKGSCT